MHARHSLRTFLHKATAFGIAACVCTWCISADSIQAADGLISDFDLSKVVGTAEANCRQCHPSEVTQWEKTTHFRSTERLKYEGNSKKYADALGISGDSLAKDSLCADCHGTKAQRNGEVSVISGVSCESCHGPSKDWLKSHGEYHDGMAFKSLDQLRSDREKESPEHRATRLESVAKAGMIRPQAIHSLASNCMDCHIVNNEKLVAAGHKAASNFELVSWSGGEVRHNFFMDKSTNAPAPSLWMATEKRTAAQRDRIKFTVGMLAQIEMALRRRAAAKGPNYVPQVGALVAQLNGRLLQINGVGPTPQTEQAAGMVAPMMGLLFVAQGSDKDTYSKAADKLSELAKQLVEGNDGSKLQGLDAVTGLVPPHFSQQYLKANGE
ncbi:MAG: multiheme c-type cytochrome [Planctomycetota bacterium]|nr:multiheme c-type cytochrome [Planctomycetota bacterium]